ncbi:hypothetical protein RRG08_059046 [Elysia crispata]|uniref:Uncharacterized protein n=1 Tax=Elysia crispata TaxID=231223 RepID=A0AAE1DED6_9GAST|nr:hypothetical protein RRG08_059046 [Elysia crispata]
MYQCPPLTRRRSSPHGAINLHVRTRFVHYNYPAIEPALILWGTGGHFSASRLRMLITTDASITGRSPPLQGLENLCSLKGNKSFLRNRMNFDRKISQGS